MKIRKKDLKRDILLHMDRGRDLSVDDLDKIVSYQFRFARKIISSGSYDSVLLPYLGKFTVKTWRLQKLKDKYNGTTRFAGLEGERPARVRENKSIRGDNKARQEQE